MRGFGAVVVSQCGRFRERGTETVPGRAKQRFETRGAIAPLFRFVFSNMVSFFYRSVAQAHCYRTTKTEKGTRDREDGECAPLGESSAKQPV